MNQNRGIIIHDILNQLETGVRQVYSTKAWKDYLRVMSRFHSYSCRNSLLIYLQKPDATMVAGYHVWNTQFHRSVRKGEKAIRILAPMKRKSVEADEEEGIY
ncbi:MAG: hypothetical protein IKG55_02695, partial [Solobacterium sp.]|nr:hypothetical protein [Solobacterium sp.]